MRIARTTLAAAHANTRPGDPARVTNIVNGLTTRGLVERRLGGDRRVRFVVLTPAGSAAVDRIGARLYATSPLVQVLDANDRSQLAALLLRLVDDEHRAG